MSRCFAWLHKPKNKEDELSGVLINGGNHSPETKSAPAASPEPGKTSPVLEADLFPEQQGADITVSPIRTVGSHLLPPPPKRDLDPPKRTSSNRKNEAYDSDDENNNSRELQRTPEVDEVGFPTSDFVTRVPITRQQSEGSLSITGSTEIMGVSAVMVTADDPYTSSSRPGLGGALGTSRTAKSSVYGGGRSLFDDDVQHRSGERSGIADSEIYMSLGEESPSGKGKGKIMKSIGQKMGLGGGTHNDALEDSTKSCGPSSGGEATSVRSGAASSNWFGGSRERSRSKGFSRSNSNRSARSKSRDRKAVDNGAEDRTLEAMPRGSRGDPDLHHSRKVETSSRRSARVSKERDESPNSSNNSPRNGTKYEQHTNNHVRRSASPQQADHIEAPPRTPRGRGERDPTMRSSPESNNSPEREIKAPVRESKRGSSRDPGSSSKHKRDKSRGRGEDEPRTPRRGRSAHEPDHTNGVEAARPSRSRSRGGTKEMRDPDPRERQMRQEEQNNASYVRGEDVARVSSSGGKIRQSQSADTSGKEGNKEGEKKISSAVQHGLKSSYLAKWPFESRHPDELSFQAGSMLYPLAYAEDEGWLWMSLTRKSFRRGVSRGNVGHGEGLVPVTHLVNGDSIPKENWAQQNQTPAGMKAVAIPSPATRTTHPTPPAAAAKESSSKRSHKDVELIPALQQREVVRTVPPEELMKPNTVTKTLAQWKAIDAQAAMEKERAGDLNKSGSYEGKRMFQLRHVESPPDRAENKYGYA